MKATAIVQPPEKPKPVLNLELTDNERRILKYVSQFDKTIPDAIDKTPWRSCVITYEEVQALLRDLNNALNNNIP